MAHPRTEKLLAEIAERLKAHGVKDYCVAVADPDDNEDVARFGGSVWWRIGLGEVLRQDGLAEHEEKREEWLKDDEEEDECSRGS